MRALPGRASRVTPEAPPASVTRSSAAADQRRRILRAIGEVVAERGYAEVTVEMIVKRAHVSFKTFYKHFSSKEECFIALFDLTVASAEQEIRDRLAGDPAPWPEQILSALDALVERIAAEPEIARAVIVESPAVGPAISERYERAMKALVPLFREGRRLNPRGADLPATLEDTLVGAIFWSAYERLVVDEAEKLVAYLPVLVELVLRAYLGQDEAARIARAAEPAPTPALA